MRYRPALAASLLCLASIACASTETETARAVLSTASTSDSFTAKAPSATAPTGDAVLQLKPTNHSKTIDFVHLLPIGSDAANEAFSMRVWAWTPDSGGVYWPTLLIEVAVTLGDIDAGDHATNYKMADTITRTYGDASARIISDGNDLPAWIVLDTVGAHYIEFDFDKDTAAAMNVIQRGI